MTTLRRLARFSAAHRYALPALTPEENLKRFGPCARPHGHGHDYVLDVTVTGPVDTSTGMIVNVTELKQVMATEVVDALDGSYLTSDHAWLAGRQPCTEVLAQVAFTRLDAALRAGAMPAALLQVSVAECRRLWCTVRREGSTVVTTLTRSYEFAAAHRLHSPQLDDAENLRVYGKCNNPHGHGHNYVLEVTVSGEADPVTGFIVDLPAVDAIVRREIVDRYDHRHLNLDVPEFGGLVTTTENVVRVIWERLAPALLGTATLCRIGVHETERNYFSYEG